MGAPPGLVVFDERFVDGVEDDSLLISVHVIILVNVHSPCKPVTLILINYNTIIVEHMVFLYNMICYS